MGRATRWFRHFSCTKKAPNPKNNTPLEIHAAVRFLGCWQVKQTENKKADDYCRKHPTNPSNNPADEESLSLSDLPINGQNPPTEQSEPILDSEEGFSFRSWNGPQSNESEICIADQIFSQGHILPMGTSSDSASMTSRSASMDHYCSYSSSFTSIISRSSTIHSHQSLPLNQTKPRLQIQQQLQFSHQKTKPEIPSSTLKCRERFRNPSQKPRFWRFFRVGLVPMPEITVADLKFRSKSRARPENSGSSLGT